MVGVVSGRDFTPGTDTARRQSDEDTMEQLDRAAVMAYWAKVCTFGLGYIVFSSGLIAFNKYLIHEDRFPFAHVLVLIHMVGGTLGAGILRLTCPWLFPSLTDPEKKVNIDMKLMLKNIVPIATLFSLQLVLSNSAYLHSTVAFLQMMKEANIVLVYALSLMALVEVFKWRNFGILCFIVLSTSLCIHGELHFSWRGFVLQGTSQLAESCKIVLQALVLSGNSKLDPMSYVLLVAPTCAVSLLLIGGGMSYYMPQLSFAAALPYLLSWWPVLAMNAAVAFCLNITIAFYIKHTSGVSFILAGVAKDVMIVIAGAILFKEHVSALQTFAFTLQIGGVFTWSLVKTFPKNFDDGLVNGFIQTFSVTPSQEKSKGYGSTNA